jgi:ADP-ribosylglycohydrolase
VAFLEAVDFEDAIRNAISLGGDADTMACIAGGIAEAYWGVPKEIEQQIHLRAKVLNRIQDWLNALAGVRYKYLGANLIIAPEAHTALYTPAQKEQTK